MTYLVNAYSNLVMIQINQIKKGGKMNLQVKKRLLDNLESLFNEMENVERDKGFKEYHSTSNHDEFIRKYYDVSNHIEDLISNLEKETN